MARSMRQHLIDQGVTEEISLRRHIQFVYDMQKHVWPRMIKGDLYRVNPENPNSFPPMMG